ncbi:DUF2218 domain-containing protein [Amycolatopsis sp. NPDC006131]|uniref:DUF2218 domain-containing protein n=1 Tax=Amycolatopsis sp. NPDC006131 TaxID=3156731 RepID=UPI0033BB306C
MVTAEGRVETDRPSRYLVQLCRHASQVGRRGLHRPLGHDPGRPTREMPDGLRAEWSDTAGTITFRPWGLCLVEAAEGALILRIDATDEDGLSRIQGIIDRNFSRFGRRDQLAVRWQDPVGAADTEAPESRANATAPPRRRGRFLAAAGVLGVALLVAAHLGAAGAAAVVIRWLGWTALGVAVVPVLVVGAHLLLPGVLFGVRRHLARRRD